MCVYAGARNVLLLCSVISSVPVPSKNSLESFDDFRHCGVQWGLHDCTLAGHTTQWVCRAVCQN